MSHKNGEGKRAARERLREQRERDRTREKHRRTLVVAAAGVAVLGVAAAVGVAVSRAGDDGGDGPVAAPSGAKGEERLAIPVGRPGAPSTLTVYEDFRCPACAQFEDAFRGTVRTLEKKGLLRVEYRLVTIIDGNLRGTGSLNAANAAACAQDAGRFPAYHDVLYRNQPPETEDAFADKKRLIELAGKVKGLVTDDFTRCVREGEHDAWVNRSTAAFTEAGFPGTPTVLLDGKNVFADRRNPLTPAELRRRVEEKAGA